MKTTVPTRASPPAGARSIIECSGIHRRLLRLCARLCAGPGQDGETFLRHARIAADGLPQALRQALREFRLHGNRSGFLLFRGMPVVSGEAAEACLAMVGSQLGELVGYLQEKDGALFHDILPDPSQEYEQSAAGSRAPLALHTERCFHPHLPSHVLLFCLRPDPGRKARTEIASACRMLPHLPVRHLPTLYQAVFRTGIDYSFGNIATEKANGPVLSVLYGDPEDPGLRYDLDLMVGLNAQAQAALASVRRAARRTCAAFRLAAGDLLVIDNRRAVHGRSAFAPRYDGSDRWLKRAYVVRKLPAVGPDRRQGERVIRTRFELRAPPVRRRSRK